MNDLYRKTFDEIHASAALRQKVLNMTKQERTTAKRQIPRMALIAAIVVLVLAGTALAAAVPGIRQWFSQQWAAQTGRPIHTDQMGLIDRLSDAVGVSAQSGGITVTVDSVTRGENVIWFLLEIGGLPPEEELEKRFSALERPQPNEESTRKKRTINGTKFITGEAVDLLEEMLNRPRGYDFGEIAVSFAPAAMGSNGYSWSLEQDGVRADGSMMVLLKYKPMLTGEATLLDALDVTLELSELKWGLFPVTQIPVAEGPWTLTFSLPAVKPPEPLTTGGGQVLGEYKPVSGRWYYEVMGPLPTEERTFQDIRVTSTGLTILWEETERREQLYELTDWFLIMEDGTEVPADFNWSVSGAPAVSQYLWPVPLDPDQARALEFRHGEEVRSFDLK